MTKPYVLPILCALSLLGSVACSSEVAATDTGDDELNAVPGAFQTRLRAASGEDVVLAFDRSTGTIAGRPECQTVVANPLRIAVSKSSGVADAEITARIDTFIRGRSIAFTRSPEDSKSGITLRRTSAVSYRAEIPNVIIAKTCSGEPTEHFQNIRLSIGGNALIDPIGNKDNFWVSLASATKSGVSATSRHEVLLEGVAQSKVAIAFGKLASDDPAQPGTCDRVEAIPARITVTPSKAANDVRVKLESFMRGPTVAATVAPSSPGAIVLTKGADGAFSADIPPFVIDSSCSGTAMDYWQTLELTVDGKIENDPVGQKPLFQLDLAATK